MSKNSHWRCCIEKAVLKNLAMFIGKHLCRRLFLIKLFQHRCFYVNIAKYRKHLFWRTFVNGCFWRSSSGAMESNICFLCWMKWSKISCFIFIRIILVLLDLHSIQKQSYRGFFKKVFFFNLGFKFRFFHQKTPVLHSLFKHG